MASVTLAMTIHNRPLWIIRAVLSSIANFLGNRPDQLLIGLDRAGDATEDYVGAVLDEFRLPGEIIRIEAPVEGPRCPAPVWNELSAHVTSDIFVMMSSDCIIVPPAINLTRMLHDAASRPIVIYGACDHVGPNFLYWRGEPLNSPITRRITDHTMGRPVGYIWSMPHSLYRQVGGFDEAYADGIAYEDTDLAIRLWQAGADFLFHDDIRALHMEHDRSHLFDKAKTERNRKIFIDRHKREELSNVFDFPSKKILLMNAGLLTHDDEPELAEAMAKVCEWWPQ